MARMVSLANFLSDEDVIQAEKIFKTDRANFHKRVQTELIEPNIRRINLDLGQQNDPGYLAYAVEHVFNQVFK